MIRTAPSILSADFTMLGSEIQSIKDAGEIGFISMLWMGLLFPISP